MKSLHAFQLHFLLKSIILITFVEALFLAVTEIIDFKYFYLFVILLNLHLVYRVRHNTFFLVFFVFSTFYAVSLIPKFFYHLDISIYSSFNETHIYYTTFIAHSIFILVLYTFLPRSLSLKNSVYRLKLPANTNFLGFFVMFFICVLILVKAQSGQTIFQAEGYSTGESSKSPLYLYFLIFFLLTYYYSTRSGVQLWLIVLLAITYSIKSVLYGSRTEVMQLGILSFYLLKIDNKIRISNFTLFIGLIFLYYLNLVFANIRDNPFGILQGQYAEILNPLKFIDNTRGIVISNEGDVFQSSARMVGMVKYGYIDLLSRSISFFGFLLSILVPVSYLPAEASLITYKQDVFVSGGGGLITAYFYCWFGFLGPALAALVVIWIAKLSLKRHLALTGKLYLLMVFSTFLQWFAYNPLILFKLCFWVIPIVCISNFLLKSIFVRKST